MSGWKYDRKKNGPREFEAKVLKTDSCWLWLGTVTRRWGRPMFKTCGKLVQAHRYAYRLYVGEIPSGMNILHSCDNPMCVNPAHLRPGTTQENVKDRVARGRSATGAANHNTKLTPDQVQIIRSYDYSKRGSAAALARSLGVSHTALNYVRTGRNHK